MKQILKKWLTHGYSLRDYYPVANIEDNINVQVIATLPSGVNLNVTQIQWTLAYNPVVIGILLPKGMEKELGDNPVELSYHWMHRDVPEGREKLAKIKARYKQTIEIFDDVDSLMLFEGTNARNYQLSALQRSILLYWLYRLSKKREKYFGTLPFKLYKQYAAQFTYPRRVMLIAVEHQHVPSFFPIDLHASVSSYYLFGLRHSNKVIPVLQKARKVVLCLVPATEYKTLYALGKFSNESTQTTLQFKRSKLFNFLIPQFASGYFEIELTNDFNIGSQQLFLGKVANEERDVSNTKFLYHVHILQFLAALEKKSKYYTLLS